MARKTTRDLQAELAHFSQMTHDEQREWLDAFRRIFAEQRRADCEAAGSHVIVDNARECAHCWTPYSEILRDQTEDPQQSA